MKKIALVFILAIMLPALLLAGLAVRSLRDQEVIANSQRIQLHQTACDGMAANLNLFMDDLRSFNGEVVDEILNDRSNDIRSFNFILQSRLSQAAGGAVVSDSGEILSPRTSDSEWAGEFLENHAAFLTNRRVVEVYQAPARLSSQIAVVEEKAEKAAGSLEPEKRSQVPMLDVAAESAVIPRASVPVASAAPLAVPPEASPRKVQAFPDKLSSFRFRGRDEQESESPAAASTVEVEEEAADGFSPVRKKAVVSGSADGFASSGAQSSIQQQALRNVAPAEQWNGGTFSKQAIPAKEAAAVTFNQYSNLNREAVRFDEIAAEESEGAVSRIIDGQLHVLLWQRSSAFPGYTFWTELDLETIKSEVALLFEGESHSASQSEISLALLDASGEPITQTVSGFETDWKRPFVASEVGQILPRWEVGAYLLNPKALDESAKLLRLTLSLITLILVSAVGIGSFLIMRSVNYEMRLATRKTDFVSNVSHELKTPLTSIRMFSELLANEENPGNEQTRNYSGVISKESARLSRLINRLLDFSRLDRGEMKLREELVALPEFLQNTVETYRLQIEAEGLALRLLLPENPDIQVKGDSDALSQVFANLLSNAEKYGAKGREIEVHLHEPIGDSVTIDVLDRGDGIPKAHQRRIFEKFYRVDDSIDSGIEGSGIGLALCRQIVELHGGAIRCSKREGGGSVFTVELPIHQP